MTIAELHTGFQIELDKVASQGMPNFLPEEIDWLYNQARDEYISKRAFGNNNRKTFTEETQKRFDDLFPIIREEQAVLSTTTDGITLATLPSDYRHMIREYIKSGGCIYNVKPITHDRLNVIFQDPFNKPDAKHPVRVGTGNVLEIYGPESGSFTYHMVYISQPANVLYGEVYNPVQVNVDPVLADYAVKEVIRHAVRIAISNIGAGERYQIQTAELKQQE